MTEIFSVNPATEEVIFNHKCTDFTTIDRLVSTALKHQNEWANTSFEERLGYVRSFQSLLNTSKDKVAECISLETGKPLWESLQEVNAVIAKVDISIDSFLERSKQSSFELNQKTYSLFYKPIGLMVVLGPFNFPAHLPHGHIIPALLAGNSILFKPSEYTTEVAKQCMDLWYEAGLPKHVLSLVVGDWRVGEYLYQHNDVNGVLFTGGYKTGQKISSYLGAYPEKLLALELGGNNPLVISEHIDIGAVFEPVIQSAFLTAGQRCTGARRLIIVNCKDQKWFENELKEKVLSLKIGPFTAADEPFMGPVIHQKSMDMIMATYRSLLDMGAREVISQEKLFKTGYFLSPAVVDVSSVSESSDEECFGPLLQLNYVNSFDEAISQANNTKYGLSASLFSNDVQEQEQFFRSVKAGIINFNGPTNGASSKLPFGGVGYSGNYRPSAFFAADYCSYPIASVKS